MSRLTFSVGDKDAVRAEDTFRARAESVRNSVHVKRTVSPRLFLLAVAGVVVLMFVLAWMAARLW